MVSVNENLPKILMLYGAGTHCTVQPFYNTVRYNMVLDITRFKDGSQKYIDYIENDHKWSFFNIIYTFLFRYNTVV